MNGKNQAVHIPHEYRIDTDQVEIFRNSDGDLVLRPVSVDRGATVLNALSQFDAGFVATLEAQQREQPRI